ncbi:hypothetical protein DBR11_21020 [Pedobacter sp. HMWF019]|uniref:MJ0042-type zinc finger domain-containing protein n=1 Tax=Pedobacter sp. HMWF019 TaxID=2056856 RepID=UPI000D362D2B|nr:MJ0042-type zinc finger domain-containing protein [Pedobacter sp. HMWF019]PTS95663.1 hypothetical protein DBR11_21020 [Pedobacter sp. HMWF019]
MFDLGKQNIDIKCPSCGSRNTVTLSQVANQAAVKCRGCSQNINLKDKDGSARRGIKELNDSIKDLENVFKKIGR